LLAPALPVSLLATPSVPVALIAPVPTSSTFSMFG
jgi:hypothetical protein